MGKGTLVLLVFAALVAGIAVPVHAADPEAEFVRLINAERERRGLSTLTVRSDLITVARRHSARMASQRRIFHNDRLRSEVRGWDTVAENVGRGGSVREIHDAFMDSPGHVENILWRPLNQIGVGIAWDGDTMYVSQVFAERYGSSAPASTSKRAPTTASSHSGSVAKRPEPPAPVPRTVAILIALVSTEHS